MRAFGLPTNGSFASSRRGTTSWRCSTRRPRMRLAWGVSPEIHSFLIACEACGELHGPMVQLDSGTRRFQCPQSGDLVAASCVRDEGLNLKEFEAK